MSLHPLFKQLLAPYSASWTCGTCCGVYPLPVGPCPACQPNDWEFQRLLSLAFDYETSQKLLEKGTNR